MNKRQGVVKVLVVRLCGLIVDLRQLRAGNIGVRWHCVGNFGAKVEVVQKSAIVILFEQSVIETHEGAE